MYLVGARAQQQIDDYFDASGTIVAGGTAQLLLPQRKSCSHLVIANNSTGILMVQIGVPPGVATVANGAVTGVTFPDGGFGFQEPPVIMFLGGGNANDPASKGGTLPYWPAPSNPAAARAVMGTSAISGLKINSIELDSGGSGYLAPPFVYLLAKRTDPTGVGTPSAAVGIPLQANGGSFYVNGTSCPTTAIAIWGATTGQAFCCKWMP